MYGILIESEFGVSRDILKSELYKAGIDTRFFFTPLHRQPCFSRFHNASADFQVSIAMADKGMYLPSSIDLTDKEIEYICDTIAQIGDSYQK